MLAIEATNRGTLDAEWAMLTRMSEVPQLSLSEFDAAPDDAFLVDVREPVEYTSGHLTGSVNIPQAELASHLDELPRDRPLITVCFSGARSYRSAQFLAHAGFGQVSSLTGGMLGWVEDGREIESDDAGSDGPKVIETEFAHAGVG